MGKKVVKTKWNALSESITESLDAMEEMLGSLRAVAEAVNGLDDADYPFDDEAGDAEEEDVPAEKPAGKKTSSKKNTEPEPEPEEPEEPEDDEDEKEAREAELNELSLKDLKAIVKKKKIDAEGTKNDLIAAILESEFPEEDGEPEDGEPEDDEPDEKPAKSSLGKSSAKKEPTEKEIAAQVKALKKDGYSEKDLKGALKDAGMDAKGTLEELQKKVAIGILTGKISVDEED